MKKIVLGGVVAAALIPGTALASPYYTSVGSPNSLQHIQVQTALSLNELEPDDDLDTPGFDMEGDADTIGGAFTYWDAAAQEGQRYEFRYQKRFRPFEGSRARVVVDVPVNILHANRVGTAVLATLSTGVEIPVKPNWLITPRVAYGVSDQAAKFFANSSEILTGSVTSRFKIDNVGRGDLTIGNMVSYSTTTKLGLGKRPAFYIGEQVWTFRNGLAYQLPLKGRVFGRQASLRFSAMHTHLESSTQQAYDNIVEAGVSIGVRTREAEQKNRFEQLRIGLLYTHGYSSVTSKADLDAFTLTLGYRF